MKFAALAIRYATFETRAGNALRDAVSDLLKHVPVSDIKAISYLTLGSIASDYDDVNLGMADKMVLRAISTASGDSYDSALAEYKRQGDVGIVAEKLAQNTTARLTVAQVFGTLHRIASTSGSGSQERKISLFTSMLTKATPLEARYLCRIAMGALRLGVASKTILEGLSRAFGIDKKDLDYAFNTCPDIGIVAETAAKKGRKGIRSIGVQVGRPVQMMLCQRVRELSDVFSKLGSRVAVEQKYDGERVQVHKDGSTVTLYSRRLENITHQFPDIVAAARKLRAHTCILEGEIMAIGPKGALLPFQTLMSRRRKHGVAEIVKGIPIKIFAFDMLYLNGTSIIDSSYLKRYDALWRTIRSNPTIKLATRVICTDVGCIEELFNSVVGNGGEGVVVKSLRDDSTYQAGTRGWHWVKWKPEYSGGLQDTFDLVVIGAYWGRGRRSGSYGALLCAAYNKNSGVFESFCKLGSGFSDAELAGLPKKLKRISAAPKNVSVGRQMMPDVWIEPRQVVEVLGAEITRSPFHTAAMREGKGYALRFPRFVTWRTDKTAEQATSTDEIARMGSASGKR